MRVVPRRYAGGWMAHQRHYVARPPPRVALGGDLGANLRVELGYPFGGWGVLGDDLLHVARAQGEEDDDQSEHNF